jgi:hypothetical protein
MHHVAIGTDQGTGGMKVTGINGSYCAEEDQDAEARA